MMHFKITHFNYDLMRLEMILNFERFSILKKNIIYVRNKFSEN